VLSKNEVARLKSLRGRLAVLCPETDGLQAKHRIRYVPEGKNRMEQECDIIAIETDIFLPFVHKDKSYSTQKLSRLISLVYEIVGFSAIDVFRILSNKRFRNRKS